MKWIVVAFFKHRATHMYFITKKKAYSVAKSLPEQFKVRIIPPIKRIGD